MKYYDPNKETSYFMYWCVSSLYEWVISQKFRMCDFERRKDKYTFNEEFLQEYDGHSNKGNILEVYVKYPRKLQKLHSDLLFLPKRTKINKSQKLVCNLHDKIHDT